MSQFNSNYGILNVRELLGRGKITVLFLGVLGSGMLPLAELLAARGYRVLGADSRLSGGEIKLPRGMAEVTENDGKSLHGVGLLVYSLAISEDNPLLLAAKDMGIPAVSRAELLGAVLTDFKCSVAISGTHGKSTTVAMLGEVLEIAGWKPTVICGKDPLSESGLTPGGKDYVVLEACEYKDSFLKLSADVVAVTNIELDHTDYFPDIDRLTESFCRFVAGAGLVFLNADDPHTPILRQAATGRVVTFGRSEGADYRITEYTLGREGSSFRIEGKGFSPMELKLSVIGEANILDAALTVAISHTLGVEKADIKRGLSVFSGVYRRLTLLGYVEGRPLYYDYAHHPTEILNTVAALKGIYGKCAVLFAPHTYSRTESLFEGFVNALGRADYTVISDVYAARESVGRVGSEELAHAIEGAVHLNGECAVSYLLRKTEGAIVLMGAGDVGKIKAAFEKMLTFKP